MLRLFAVAALVLCLPANDSLALPIQFTYTSVGTGSIGETSFSNAAVTITAFGDTANRWTDYSDTFDIGHSAASVAIDGVGTFSFTSATRTFVNQTSGIIGFSRGAIPFSDLIHVFTLDAETWDMLESLGPISGGGKGVSSVFLQWADHPVLTDGGRLIFLGTSGESATFQATVVPEPSTYLLGAFVLLGLLAFRRARGS